MKENTEGTRPLSAVQPENQNLTDRLEKEEISPSVKDIHKNQKEKPVIENNESSEEESR